MHAYTELLKPEVVTHLELIPGRNKGEVLLFAVKGGSLIQVYELSDHDAPKWIAEYPLQGQVVRFEQLSNHELLVAFKPARMVVMKFNYSKRLLETQSMHYYEHAAVNHPNFGTTADHENKMSVDTLNSNVLFWFQPQIAACVQPKMPDPIYSQGDASSELQSELFSPIGLAANLDVASIVDLEYLNAFSEPTLGVLACNTVNWAGLEATRGENTNSLFLVAQKPTLNPHDLRFRGSMVAKIDNLSRYYTRIKSLKGNEANIIGILIGSTGLGLLTIDMEIVEVLKNSDWCFEKCVIEQMDNSAGIYIALQDGTQILLDIKRRTFTDITLPKEDPSSKNVLCYPTAISLCNGFMAVSSRLSGVQIYNYEAHSMSKPSGHSKKESVKSSGVDNSTGLHEMYSLHELYASPPQSPPCTDALKKDSGADTVSPQSETTLNVSITTKYLLPTLGPISSVTRIDDGLACTTDAGLVIVDQKMTLDVYDRFRPQIELDPGNFWIVDSNGKRLLVANVQVPVSKIEEQDEGAYDNSEKKREQRNHESKRRKTDEDPSSVLKLVFRDLSVSEDGEPVEIPESLNQEEKITSVLADAQYIYIVQPHQIVKLNPSNLEFIEKHALPVRSKAESAELSGSRILVRFEKTSQIIDCDTLKPLRLKNKAAGTAITSISSAHLATMEPSQGLLQIHSFSTGAEQKYDVSDLGEFLEPTESPSSTEDLPEYFSVYVLTYGRTEFVGIHSDRVFTVYEITDDSNLVKRHTVPFAVNRSPIWLPKTEILVFPGRNPHVLVKSDQTAFECHQLKTRSDKLVDAIQYIDKKMILLDETNKLHFCMLDPEIDYLSNSLPLQHIRLPNQLVMPALITFNDDTGTIIVGANEVVALEAPEEPEVSQGEDPTTEDQPRDEQESSSGNDSEPINGSGEIAEGENQNDETREEDNPENYDEHAEGEEEEDEDMEAPEEEKFASHKGRIYAISLYSRKFQDPVLELDETLLSMQVLYPSTRFEKTPKQILAVGTSNDAIETEQTNGHIRLYGIKEELSMASVDGDEYEEEEFDLVFSEYASELLRGPVSAIFELMDYVVIAHGQQIKVYDYVQGLVPVGFFQTHPYMQDLKCMRNLVVLGEKLHPPRLVNFALQPRRLDLLGSADSLTRGNGLSPTCSIETISSEERGDLVVVYATEDGRIQLFSYDPENPASLGGQRLVPYRSFFTGHKCVAMCQSEAGNSGDILAFGATVDGSVFSVRPLSEAQFRALYLLTQQMMEKEPNYANLNPRMHRAYFEPHSAAGPGTASTGSETPASQLIDINYAQRFWAIPRGKQLAYTRSLGYDGLRKVQMALNGEGRDPMRMQYRD